MYVCIYIYEIYMCILQFNNQRTTNLIKIRKVVEEILHKVKYTNGPKVTEKIFKRTLEINKIQINTTMRYYYVPARMFKIKQ